MNTMKKVNFKVFGTILTKQRPRATTIGGHARVYTPQTTINYENLIRLCYEQQCGGITFGNHPIMIRITANFLPPESLKKYVRFNLQCTNAKDYDNIEKVVSDALNKIAYDDDRQIVTSHLRKQYSLSDQEYIEVEISEVYGSLEEAKESYRIDKISTAISELKAKEKLSKAQKLRLEKLKEELELLLSPYELPF